LRTVLGLIVIALFAYLGTALFRISRVHPVVRAIISSGIGFFLVGILLGPFGTALFSPEILQDLDVVVNLGVGWVGLLFGLQFRYWDLRKLPLKRYLGAATESLMTFLIVLAGAWTAVMLTPRAWPVWLTVMVLASIGSTTSPTTGAQAIHDVRPRGPVTDTLRLFASVDAIPAIIFLGTALCFSALHPSQPGILPTGFYWLLISCALGVVLGVLFHLLTLYRYTDNQLLVIVLGLVVFCGGAAHFLRLSPLFVNLIVGVVMANRSPQHLRVLQSLLRLEEPFYLVLLALAGAMWQLPALSLLALVPMFVLLRIAGKLLGGAVATRVAGLSTVSKLGVGPGLLSHGGMALVIALSVKLYFPEPLGDLALTAAIVSILVGTLIGPWALRRLLTNEGEVR
jgi:Kef-type K+ transport system membrane component KefB